MVKFKKLLSAFLAVSLMASVPIAVNAESAVGAAETAEASISEENAEVSVSENVEETETISLPLEKYPDGSYFSKTGKPCTCHSDGSCYWDNSCDCINFDMCIQSIAFARYVYCAVHNLDTFDKSNKITYDQALTTGEEAKEILLDKPAGTYIYGQSGTLPHAIILAEATEDEITFYHANGYSGNPCMVTYETRTWDSFIRYFNTITYCIE